MSGLRTLSRMQAADAWAIGRLDGHGQAELARRGDVSVAELTEAAIVRVEALDPTLNSLCHRAFDLARARAAVAAPPSAERPLSGVPWLIKDSLRYPGMPAYSGSRAKTETSDAPPWPFAGRYDAEGLVPLGKSAMPEFGLLGSTETLRFGVTRNPWDFERTCGGSSGGAAAAVAGGLAALAHASDAAGSIRIPAAACGLVGYKPGRGANVRARDFHWLDDLLCGDSLLSRSVRDVAWAAARVRSEAAAAVTGPSTRRLRIGLMLTGMDGSQPEPVIAEALRAAASLCADLGHQVSVLQRPADHADLLHALFDVLWPYIGGEAVDHYRGVGRPLADLLEPWTLTLGVQRDGVTPERFEAALAWLARAPAINARSFDEVDVVLSPTTGRLPPAVGVLSPTRTYDEMLADLVAFIPYTPLQNMAGAPAISLPLAATPEGLPIGVMLAGDRGADDTLMQLAFELEAERPWAARWPACVPA